MSNVLSPEDIAAFERCGYLSLNGAFSSEDGLAMQQTMWQELRDEFGIDREDRSTWRQPPRDLRRAKIDPAQHAMNTERLLGASNQLLEVGRWDPLPSWGRALITFPTTAPEPWRVPSTVWHWDCALAENVGAIERLLVLTFFSEVDEHGGGTLIVEGSHRLLRSYYESLSDEERKLGHRKLRKRFLKWDAWLQRLSGLETRPEERNAYFMSAAREVRDVPLRVVELTGRPGDAVLCHPLILHASSQNHADWPRFMRIKFPGASAATRAGLA